MRTKPSVNLSNRLSEIKSKLNATGVIGAVKAGPLKYSGSLDKYERFDVTPTIGREFPKLQLSEILSDDKKIRDLAITG